MNPSPLSRYSLRFLLAASFAWLLEHSPTVFASDLVVVWNRAITDCQYASAAGDRESDGLAYVLALAHHAMFEAMQASQPSPDSTRRDVAAAVAAHDVAVALIPGERARFEALLQAELRGAGLFADLPAAVELGRTRAAGLLRDRGYDGAEMARGLAPGGAPGPRWHGLSPLVLKKADQIHAVGPNSGYAPRQRWLFLRNKTVARLLRKERAAEWPEIAAFWAECPVHGWNRLARRMVESEPQDPLEHARLFATLNAALADAGMAARKSREFHGQVRWSEQMDVTPFVLSNSAQPPKIIKVAEAPIPNFPSVNACLGGAAAAAFIWYFGDDRHPFSIEAPAFSGLRDEAAAPRAFQCFTDAAKEQAMAGFMAGTDFKDACILGYEQGFKVGRWVVKRASFAGRL